MYSKKLLDYFKNPVNVGKIADADAVGEAGNPMCLTPRSIVYTDAGTKDIEKIETGDRVLSHDGNFHQVLKIYKRNYKGTIYRIKVHNIGEIKITSEHLIFAIKTGKYLRKYKQYRGLTAGWFEAQELEKGDIPLYSVMSEESDVKDIKFDIPKLRRDFKSKNLPNSVKVDRHFLGLIGYYLSEGSVRTDKCKGTVCFTFSKKEGDYVKDTVLLMKKVFNFDVGKIYDTNQNCFQVLFYSARLARFFEKHFGKGAENKCLPMWAFLLPKEKQRYILRSLWRGDGYFNASKHKAKYVTISRNLAYQLRLMLLKQRIIFSFLKVAEKGIHRENYCFYIKERLSLKKLAAILDVEYKERKKYKDNPHSWFEGNFYYSPISQIKVEKYSGVVYNLEIENTHSYLTEAAVVHNCGDMMKMYIKIKNKKSKIKNTESKIIAEAKFETLGCGAAIAMSSRVTELIIGKTINEAKKLKAGDVAEGFDLPKQKYHCSILGIEALKNALADYEKRSMVSKGKS